MRTKIMKLSHKQDLRKTGRKEQVGSQNDANRYDNSMLNISNFRINRKQLL